MNISKYLVLLVFLNLEIFSQTEVDYGKVFLSDVNDFFQTGVNLVKQPTKWEGNDWLLLGGSLASTAVLFTIDDEVRNFALRNQSKFNDALFSVDDWITGPIALILPSAIYLYGFFANNKKVRRLGLHSAEALIYSTIITSVLKYTIGRSRPYTHRGNTDFLPFTFSTSNFSLPSGHATAAFALASVFSSAYENVYWDIFCYGTATAIAFARVYHDKHWLSDISLGGVIGYSVGSFIANSNTAKINIGKVKITPSFGFNSFGIIGKF